jgi:uncharacterized membrane protein YkvA (DUF1232 family)
LKDLKIYFTDEGLRLCALIKLHDMLPEISAEAILVLESFDFKPGMHIFIFRLKGQPEFSFPEQSNKVYVGFLRYIFENVVGPKRILESIGRALNEMDFLIWDEEREGRVTLDLDKHPEAQKLFAKTVPLIGVKIIDYVGIREIIIRRSEVELRPKIHVDEFQYQSVFEQAADKVRKEMNAASAIASDKKRIFNRLRERVKRYPDALQAHIERELPKLKETTGKLGGELWEGINFLWEAMRDPNVPQEAKYTAIAALLYFVSPIDLISDILPGGYVDDGVVLALAVKAVKEILVRHQYNISAGASGMHDMGDDETDRTDAGNRCRDSSFAHETGGV